MDAALALPLEPTRRICVPSRSVIHAIDTRQIVHIQSISNYSKLFFVNGKTLVVAKVLRWFEERLGGDGFLRVHRTHLVNTGHIRQYWPVGEGSKLELTNGALIDVSKRKKSEFLRLIRSRPILTVS
jgi:two-component system, LytTR family, response regulator